MSSSCSALRAAASAFGYHLARRERTSVQRLELDVGQGGIRRGEVRLPGDGVLEIRDGLAHPIGRLPPAAAMPFRYAS